MSVASPKSSEPSMEEILASIRKIIADDPPEAEKAEAVKAEPARVEVPKVPAPPPKAAPVQPPAPPPPVPDDDVLDLDDEPEPVLAVDQSPAEDDIMFIEREEEAQQPSLPPPASAPVMAPPPAPMPTPMPAMSMDDGLLSAQTDAAVSHAFQNLAGTILAGSQRTLDDLVKEMLRPMLKTWLDDNLPAIVERLVRAEIERVARGR